MKFPVLKGFDEGAFNKYLKNTGLLMLGRIGSMGIKMAVGILLANHLLPFDNGVLSLALVYVYFFASFAGLGLDQFVVKELHQFPQNRDRILGTAFLLKVMGGAICVPAIVLAWHYVYSFENIPAEFIFILSFTGLAQSLSVVDSYFQSEVKSKYIMQVQIIGNLVSAGIKVILILLDAPLIYFVAALLIDVVLLSFGYFLVYQRKNRNIFNWSYSPILAKKLLHFSWPLIVSGIMVSIYMKIDQFMLEKLLPEGTSKVGIYNTVVSFSEALNFVPIVIVSSLFPAILNAKRDDPQRYQKRLQNLFDLMVWLSLAFAIFISLAAPLIYKLLYKPEYLDAVPALIVHVWSSLFVFLGVASSQFLIAEGYSKLTFIRTGIGAIVNIVLNLILIPKYGIVGTAIATLLAYAVATFSLLFIPRTHKQGIMMLKSLFLVSAFQKLFKH